MGKMREGTTRVQGFAENVVVFFAKVADLP